MQAKLRRVLFPILRLLPDVLATLAGRPAGVPGLHHGSGAPDEREGNRTAAYASTANAAAFAAALVSLPGPRLRLLAMPSRPKDIPQDKRYQGCRSQDHVTISS